MPMLVPIVTFWPSRSKGLGNDFQHPDRESDGCLSLICLATLNDRKFIAAKSRQNIGFTQRRFQAARQFLKQLIPRSMSKRIVDMFEPIEVQQENCECFLTPPQTRQGFFQFLMQDRLGCQCQSGHHGRPYKKSALRPVSVP